MDTSIRCDHNPSSDTDHELKFIPKRGLYRKVVYILYSVLVLLLFILLLITGLKFSQLNQDLADVKLSILTLDNSVMDIQAASLNSGSTKELVQTAEESMFMASPSPISGPCDEGWIHFSSTCYLFSKSKVNWHKAEELCCNDKAYLAVLHDGDHLINIAEMLNHGEFYWIGLVERDTEGVWSWVDGSNYKTSSKYWDEGQPEYWVDDGQDCGQIRGVNREDTAGYWNDAVCSLNYRYICSKEEYPRIYWFNSHTST